MRHCGHVAAAGLLVLAVCLLGGCYAHRQGVADSAASIWEAAEAVRRGVAPEGPLRAIQAHSVAIIRAQGRTYPPSEPKSEEEAGDVR